MNVDQLEFAVVLVMLLVVVVVCCLLFVRVRSRSTVRHVSIHPLIGYFIHDFLSRSIRDHPQDRS